MADHQGLRFRIYVGGQLRAEEWVDEPADAPAAAERHARMALGPGQPWLVEVFNPDAPPDSAYLRFGTDQGGMVEPLDLDVGDMLEAGGAAAAIFLALGLDVP